ncbi:MAG: ATP-binding protein [Candidatus Eremiobacteraeota bacterium]|nr:ATP-binding protein [Candidatus Eremiobacteraeota bacterium]
MDPVRNPYGPGAGTPPPELTGREALISDARIALERKRRGLPHKSFILVGLRGVGKTVLLNRVDELAREAGFKTAMIEVDEDKTLAGVLIPEMRRVLYELDRLGPLSEAVKRGLRVLRSFVSSIRVHAGEIELGLDVDPEVGTADSGDLDADLAQLFVALGDAAQSRNTAVALIIDELQYLDEPEFRALIMAVHRASQRNLPVLLVGAGLPPILGLAGRAKSYAERLFDYPTVGPLVPADARRAVEEPARREYVEFEPRALDEIVRITQGYPYFVQEWAYHAWNIANASKITRDDVVSASDRAIKRLDESFFRVRFDRLTPSEKRYLRAMAELGAGPHRSGDVATKYGAKVTTVGPIRGKLISKGMIYGPAYGDVAFTVPLFDQFIKRTMPTLK